MEKRYQVVIVGGGPVGVALGNSVCGIHGRHSFAAEPGHHLDPR